MPTQRLDSAFALLSAVRQRRLELGLTHATVAARVGISVRTYARLEASGATTLGRLARVAEVLGLTLALLPTGAGALAVDPRLHRQRGLRKSGRAAIPEPAVAPSESTVPPANPASPAGGGRGTRRSGEATPRKRTPVSSAAEAEIASKHRDAIRLLVRNIVLNRLNNYNAGTVVQNVMRARLGLANDAWPAFVAAVESELQGLNGASIAEFSIDPPHYELWARTWDPELGIIHALD